MATCTSFEFTKLLLHAPLVIVGDPRHKALEEADNQKAGVE